MYAKGYAQQRGKAQIMITESSESMALFFVLECLQLMQSIMETISKYVITDKRTSVYILQEK